MKKIFKALFIASTLALAMPLISCSDDDGGSSPYTVNYNGQKVTDIDKAVFDQYKSGFVYTTDYTMEGDIITLTESGWVKFQELL